MRDHSGSAGIIGHAQMHNLLRRHRTSEHVSQRVGRELSEALRSRLLREQAFAVHDAR